jgi:hypothetical protein
MRRKYTSSLGFYKASIDDSFYENISFGRLLVVKEFVRSILPLIEGRSSLEVCVVGGYSDEPEIEILRKLGFEVKINTFGIDDSDYFMDLNIVSVDFPKKNFDLILFSQTLEHIWNHSNAFTNISNLSSPGTLLWVSCPASNRHHGSPDYFSAGFMPDYLTKNLLRFDFTPISSGKTGSVRNYLATHLLPYWLSPKSHSFPLFLGAESYRPISRIAISLIFSPVKLLLIIASSRVTDSPRWATESWALFTAK